MISYTLFVKFSLKQGPKFYWERFFTANMNKILPKIAGAFKILFNNQF